MTELVERALSANLDLEVRRLRLAEARLDPAVPRSWLWPARFDVQGDVQRLRQQFPDADHRNVSGTDNEADLFAVVRYDLDLAGRRAALRQAADQREEALRDSGEALAVAVAAEVADTWFALLEERSQRALLARQLAGGDGLLAVVQARVDQQLASRLDLLQQRLQIASIRTQVPQVEARQRQLEHHLASLLGQDPARPSLPADAALPRLPPLPATDVAALIAARPDVRQADALIAEAEQRRRAQISTWVPTVSLFAQGGLQTFELSAFGRTTIWGYGAQLTWPLFDGGQRLVESSRLEVTARRLRAERAQIVLRASREVEDALALEEKTAAFLAELSAELTTGQAALEEAKVRYQHGLSDYTPLLTTLRIVADLERQELLAQGQLLAVRVHLHEVLATGGR